MVPILVILTVAVLLVINGAFRRRNRPTSGSEAPNPEATLRFRRTA